MVVAGSTEEVAPTAEVAASMVAEVAAPTVAAGPTGEATGNCDWILNLHVNGWQRILPAVFLFLSLPLIQISDHI